MARLTIKIDPTLCITAAICTGVSPELFQINEEGMAEVKDGAGEAQGYSYAFEATAVQEVLIEEAVESCPSRAISIER